MSSILLVPSRARGNGSGHLMRCFDLAKRLGAIAAVYLPYSAEKGERGYAELQLAFPNDLGAVRVLPSLEGMRFSLVVLDKRETSLEELRFWEAYGPVAALDEGGEARAFASYLIDILPRVARPRAAGRAFRTDARGSAANKTALGFLSLPLKRRQVTPRRAERVLVSFGGEDSAGLTERFLALAVDTGRLTAKAVTVVSGALTAQNGHAGGSGAIGKRGGITMLGPVQDLKEKLHGFDLVVTQFGITAYEAAWAGCAVLLLNPSPYHEKLSKAAGFPTLGRADGVSAAKKNDTALNSIGELAQRCTLLAPDKRDDLAAFLKNLAPTHAGPCPSCGAGQAQVISRAERKSYRRCARCGLVSMAYFFKRENPYTESSYFFDDYKAQYGRTYLEDLPKLRRMASERLDRIAPCLRSAAEPIVLDVGCAYGAFLAEAHKRGWHAIGSDVSSQAVDYVRTSLNIPAFVADFTASGNDGFYPRGVDCLSMWYVIEHFDELGKVLRRVRALLKDGGVFAFSTPSCLGISARARPADFWERSPDDHYTVWNPKSVRRILKTWGFDVQSIRVTGHHPERFPGVTDNERSWSYKAAGLASRLFGLGDTFECYAVKRGSN